MQTYDCIIIGAGISGLTCAEELSAQGQKVLIVEARDRMCGRIFTQHDPQIDAPVDLGPEFVHGAPKILLDRLDRLHISYHILSGTSVLVSKSKKDSDEFWDAVDKLEKKMTVRKRDQTIHQFLESHKADSKTKSRFRSFVEGFHAADTRRISEKYLAIARNESTKDDAIEKSFRLKDGYCKLVESIASSLQKSGGEIKTGCEVRAVHWEKNKVVVETSIGNFQSIKLVITLPIGVLKADRGDTGWIDIQPRPEKLDDLLSGFEMGHVVKIIFIFKSRFWEKLWKNNVSFIHSTVGQDFPTWWSMVPVQVPMLVAWQGGPKAHAMTNQPQDEIIQMAIKSLAKMVKTSVQSIRKQIVNTHVHDWAHDPYSRGAYSYVTVDGVDKVRELHKPFDNTLYFTGEAFSPFPHVGTVHGAMEAGLQTAKKIVKHNA